MLSILAIWLFALYGSVVPQPLFSGRHASNIRASWLTYLNRFWHGGIQSHRHGTPAAVLLAGLRA